VVESVGATQPLSEPLQPFRALLVANSRLLCRRGGALYRTLHSSRLARPRYRPGGRSASVALPLMRFASAAHSAACAGEGTNRTIVVNALGARQAVLRCPVLVGSKPAVSERSLAISCVLAAAGRFVPSITSPINLRDLLGRAEHGDVEARIRGVAAGVGRHAFDLAGADREEAAGGRCADEGGSWIAVVGRRGHVRPDFESRGNGVFAQNHSKNPCHPHASR
jgi:hypothetical protein